MINNLSDNSTKWLIKKNILKQEQYSNFDYYFRITLFNLSVLISLFGIAYLLNTYKELIIICLIFNILRVFAGGVHARKLEFCFIFSTCYFTLLSLLAHKIIYSMYALPHFIMPIIAIVGSLYIYIKYIPKLSEDDIKEIANNPEALTIEERKKAYIGSLIILVILMIIGIIFLCPFLSVSVAMGLLSVIFIIADEGEYVFNKIQDLILG